MARNARWAVIFILSAALAGLALIASAGTASAADISGTVADRRNNPVPGAAVTLYQDGQECLIANNPATTGASGFYTFAGLPSGAYSIMVEKDGFTYSGTVTLESADVIMDIQIPGYTYTAPSPTLPPNVITPPPLATPTVKPTATPTPKPSNTPVPLPSMPAEPGFGALIAVVSIGLIAVASKWSGKR